MKKINYILISNPIYDIFKNFQKLEKKAYNSSSHFSNHFFIYFLFIFYLFLLVRVSSEEREPSKIFFGYNCKFYDLCNVKFWYRKRKL